MKKSPAALQKFAQRKLKYGYPQGELRNDLLNEGYTVKEIELAIFPLAQRSTAKRQKDYPLWFVITTGLGITGIALKSANFILFFEDAGLWLIAIGVAGLVIRLLPLLSGNNGKIKNDH